MALYSALEYRIFHRCSQVFNSAHVMEQLFLLRSCEVSDLLPVIYQGLSLTHVSQGLVGTLHRLSQCWCHMRLCSLTISIYILLFAVDDYRTIPPVTLRHICRTIDVVVCGDRPDKRILRSISSGTRTLFANHCSSFSNCFESNKAICNQYTLNLTIYTSQAVLMS